MFWLIETLRMSEHVPSEATKKLLEKLLETGKSAKQMIRINSREVTKLCSDATKSFSNQPTLLELKSPIKICGDMHGQWNDLMNIFKQVGQPPNTRYLFLGDYVDRGSNSLETICTVLALKVCHPNNFFLVRGNHETEATNRRYGFYDEIEYRFKGKQFDLIFDHFNRVFDNIPMAAIVNKNIFCCHGGIGPELEKISQIKGIDRPLVVDLESWIGDLLWSDPDEEIKTYERMDQPKTNRKHRGAGYLFGEKAVAKFLKDNKLSFICRAHEWCAEGYRWNFNKKCLTVFSAPGYKNDNPGAILSISQRGNLDFHRILSI